MVSLALISDITSILLYVPGHIDGFTDIKFLQGNVFFGPVRWNAFLSWEFLQEALR